MPIVQAFTTYTLNVCLTYSVASNPDETDVIPVNVFLRQK